VDGVTYTVELSPDLSPTSWDTGFGLLEEVSVSSIDSEMDAVTVRSTTPISGTDAAFIRLRIE
jgi:hypothetical protein